MWDFNQSSMAGRLNFNPSLSYFSPFQFWSFMSSFLCFAQYFSSLSPLSPMRLFQDFGSVSPEPSQRISSPWLPGLWRCPLAQEIRFLQDQSHDVWIIATKETNLTGGDRYFWNYMLEKGMSIDTKGSCPHPPALGKIKHNSLLGEGLNTLALSWLERKLHLYWNDTSKNCPQVLAKVCDVNQAGERPRLWFMTCLASCESEDFVLGLFLILKLKQPFEGELAYWDEVEIDLFHVSWSLVLKAFLWLYPSRP